ncbi:MAG: hypothetical protein JWL85_837 [Candidatus Saccharibacteria bacterium]|nr:hypothetical protein [Candidatus Saccharibacteria bacterium]
MKIGLVCPYNIFKGGGVQECVRASYDELARRGYDVRIITPQPGVAYQTEQHDGIIFLGRSRDVKTPLHTTAQVSVSVNNEALEAVLEEEKFDILHFHEPWVPILSRQILARSQSVNIATFHAKLPDTFVSRTIEMFITPYTRGVLKDLDYLTAVSDAAAEYVKSITDQPVHLIPNGIDLNRYSCKGRAKVSDQPVILYVGRLEKRKGVKYLLDAMARLQVMHPEAKLLIAGDGPDRQKLTLQAEELNLTNVEFLGYIEEDEKLRLLSEADLFVSPALYGESFGIVLLEAMACGVPLVAGNNPGYTSVMKDRGRLSLVDPKDTEAFAQKISLLLYDEELRALWKKWAEGYIKQFSYGNVIDQYEKLYKEAVLKS